MATLRTGKRLLLGREIAHMIGVSGVKQADAAKIIEKAQSFISGLIDGERFITVGDLEKLARELGFDNPGYLDVLRDLRRDNHKRGAWTTGYMRAYHEDVRLLVDLEQIADLLREVQSEAVPGLLQCESYVRAVHARSEAIEDSVQARLARQEVLRKKKAPEFRTVLSESCLRRVYGGTRVMREQIEHLIRLAKRPNITIQILPFAVGSEGIGIQDRFTLVRVPSPGVAGPLELAYLENIGEIRYVDDKKVLAQRESVWADLSTAALNAGDSIQFLQYTLGSYE